MKKQVSKSHYSFQYYVTRERWNSYYCQIDEVMKCKGKNVLYIGVGDSIVVDTLKKFGKNVKVLDFEKDFKPDYLGSVTEIDQVLGKDKSRFDIVVCSQVLEHIPFEQFEPTVEKISKYAKEKFILSIPNRSIWIRFRLPIIHGFKIKIKRPFDKKWDIEDQGCGEHYWEIDAVGCPKKKDICAIVQKYFQLERTYTLYENPYHTFFILKKKR